jgi:hypothetical protein
MLPDSMPFPKNVVKLHETHDYCKSETDALIGVASIGLEWHPLRRPSKNDTTRSL